MSEEKKEDQLLESNYDGIQEYDNDLPNWWLWLFYITIIFSIVYVAYYHFGPGLNPHQMLALEMAEHEKIIEQNKAAIADQTVETVDLITLVGDADRIAKGKVVYDKNCMACHADKGQGLVGPNMTDNYWIHGGSLADIRRITSEGVVAKGMIPWKGVISEEEIDNVTLFVYSLKGTNIEGKGPEGDLEE
jgi:cytochrome c oxidase cbb3-type subunit 3